MNDQSDFGNKDFESNGAQAHEGQPGEPAGEATPTADYLSEPQPQPQPQTQTQTPPYVPLTPQYQPAPRVDQAPAKPRARLSLSQVVAVAALSSLLGAGAGGFVALELADSGTIGGQYRLDQAAGDTSARADDSIAAIASAVTPSVVFIQYETFNSAGSGSGFIIDSNGYILTNNHVVEAAASSGKLTVELSDGASYEATIVGRNSAYDLAVIKINASGLPAVNLGDSSSLVVGDSVVAVGAPLGLEGTVTTGIVSALNRPVTTEGSNDMSYISAIQTDAAINPGNSGGPLVNSRGQVIGINSAIATLSSMSAQTGSIGLGFAIPVNQAKRIAEEIINTGESQIPVIGVQVQMVSDTRGATLAEIEKGGPAAKAGLKAGDVIVRVDGRIVRDATEFIVAVRAHAPGDDVKLTLASGKELTIKLGARSTKS